MNARQHENEVGLQYLETDTFYLFFIFIFFPGKENKGKCVYILKKIHW
jgi:hypothetical protein